MKNFLLQKTIHGETRWLLLRLSFKINEAAEYVPFSSFVTWMEKRKGYAPNTVDQYAGHVARFIDFIYEASQVASKPEITHLIDLYEDYLVFGRKSSNLEVVELARRLNKTKTTTYESISQGIEAAIKLFLEFKVTTLDSEHVSDVFKKFYIDTSKRSGLEKEAMRNNSWLVSTIKSDLERCMPYGNTKLFSASKVRMRRTSQGNSNSPIHKHKAFPLDKAVEFLTQNTIGKRAVFLRNMSFFSLLAASGARSSEILQLRTDDIDIENYRVYIRSPFERNFKGLGPDEVRALSWKGRATDETFLIEPFASIFWEYFSQYITDVFLSNVNHDFVFQKSNGRPLFTWDISNRNKVMRRYAEAIGMDAKSTISPHSFRHMYGFYTLNYLPLDSGKTIGLPMAYVKILMGHQSIKSTERYALQDIELVALYVELANKYSKSLACDITEIKKRFIDSQIARLESMKVEDSV